MEQVFVGEGMLTHICRLFPDLSKNGFFVVSDSCVGSLYAKRLGEFRGEYQLPRGEKAKSLEHIKSLYDAFLLAGIDRHSYIIALGGGSIGDTVGFASATWLRGVPLIQCPTTLLAMVDSSIGGKVGVNLPQGKNLVGAFYTPKAVVMDISTLETLSDADFRQGLAEIVKYGVGEDREFLNWIGEHLQSIVNRDSGTLKCLVEESVRIKQGVVAEDWEEKSNVRVRLNLGHTIGHALEGASDYTGWRHGDAVAVGLVVALEVSKRKGLCSVQYMEKVLAILTSLGLPTSSDLPWGRVVPFLMRDKKFQKDLPRFVYPLENGKSLFDGICVEDLRHAYESVQNNALSCSGKSFD